MTLNTTKTVRELALEMPDATRVFEKLKIDYCCGGGKTLEAACAAAGVKIGDVADLLERAKALRDQGGAADEFLSMPLAELVNYILEKHHTFTKEEMERIGALTVKVCAAHGERHPELSRVGALFGKLCDDLRPHMMKEEQVLFPYIVRLEGAVLDHCAPPFAPFGTVNNPVRMMMYEHDTAGELLRELRAATSDYAAPADACMSYRTLYGALEAFEQDLHQHIHLENNVLFPRAVELESAAYSVSR